jgi:lysophospholipase L1-like esterase
MNELSKKRNIDFLVLLIPTKESVFSEFIEHNSGMPSSDIIDKLISNERRVNQFVKGYFKDHGIEFIDVLDPLKNAAGSIQLYPNNFGGHSNKNGYRIMAKSIMPYLTANNKDCFNSN